MGVLRSSFAVVLATFGCVGEVKDFDDPPLPAAPDASVSCQVPAPATVDFGRVPGGAVEARMLSFCTDVQILADDDGAFEIGADDEGCTTIVFRPRRIGPHTGAVELDREVVVELEGLGAMPRLRVVPARRDVPDVELGCRGAPADFDIFNDEDVPLAIDRLFLMGDASAFELIASSRMSIAPNTSVTVGITSTPLEATAAEVGLYFELAGFDPIGGPLAEVRGRGVDGRVVRDEFRQESLDELDVLFVMSASADGISRAGALANIESLLQFYGVGFADVRVAFTDGAIESGLGGTLAAPGIIDPTAPGALVAAREAALASMAFATEVQLFAATLRALTSTSATGANAGFLRPNAALSIVVVSDRADRSIVTVDDFINALQDYAAVRTNSFVTFSAIMGDHPGGCVGPGGSAEAAPRLIEAVDRGGRGVFESVCIADWGRSLEPTPDRFPYLGRHWLSEVPIASTIEVMVDGRAVPPIAAGGIVNWRYDSATQSVSFSPFAAPEPGVRFAITYQTHCKPPARP